MPLCECGCGTEVAKRYIYGHNRRGKQFTPEQQAARSASFKAKGFKPPVPSPEARRKAAESNRGQKRAPDVGQRISASRRESAKWKAWTERMKTERQGSGNPAWKGGRSSLPYHYSWTPALKALIRDRDGNVCKSCGRRATPKRALDVHHLNGDKQDCEPDNLIALCHPCHQRAHVGTGITIERHKLDPVQAPTLHQESPLDMKSPRSK